jgi:hypothetical protein
MTRRWRVALARSLAILVEHSGPDADSLAAIARAARSPTVRAAATAPDLFEIGKIQSYGDIEVLDDLASLATEIAIDDRSRLAAHHLAGWADVYHQRTTSAMTHLDAAERIAIECDDVWQLASIRQAKGVALRRKDDDDPVGAMTMFESAAETYALAGDPMHVNNCRYMMASAAADGGHRRDEAVDWIDECEAHARAAGNDHELAHARLTRMVLIPSADDDALLLAASDTFRAMGDLRCLTRCYLRRAAFRAQGDQIPLLEEALVVADHANDHTNQATVLERLITAQWETGAHQQAATTLGVFINLVGHDTAISRCPPVMRDNLPQWRIAIAEGRARGHAALDEPPQHRP